ncbi:MAG TPA: MmcQ/YjbR family DNA-binding protein [Pyrinomonadaceae bacterium]|nr:MmcQ/YjbR family DNA-binding protein [Pyrinomonadaceae bacterium]
MQDKLQSLTAKRRAQLIAICQRLPETEVDVAGESHLSFRIRKKIFAYYLFDHHGDGMIAFSCKSTLNEQRRLVKDDPISFFVPAYVGPRGWVGVRLDLDEVDWETITELAKRAYQDSAPRKLAALVE